jgi:hypothetical protein
MFWPPNNQSLSSHPIIRSAALATGPIITKHATKYLSTIPNQAPASVGPFGQRTKCFVPSGTNLDSSTVALTPAPPPTMKARTYPYLMNLQSILPPDARAFNQAPVAAAGWNLKL